MGTEPGRGSQGDFSSLLQHNGCPVGPSGVLVRVSELDELPSGQGFFVTCEFDFVLNLEVELNAGLARTMSCNLVS